MSAKLTVRDWEQGDMVKLAQFHQQMDVGYPLPESFGPLYAVKRAVVNEKGEVVALATLKLTSEAFIWLDPEIPSFTRTESVTLLSQEMSKVAKNLGLDDATCWIPEHIAKYFAKIIEKLGWKPSPWKTWTVMLR